MMNKVIKDIINRYKMLSGYKVYYQMGFDCHGTNIEELVTNSMTAKASINDKFDFLKEDTKMVNIADQGDNKILEFRGKCKSFTENSIADQLKYYLRFGIMSDWTQSYLTMSKNYIVEQLEYFKKIIYKGNIV